MKKLTAGIFTVLLGLVAANSADAAVASKGYVDEMVGVNTTAIETLGGTVAGHTQSIADLTAADTAINAKIGDVADGKTVVDLIADAKQEAIDGVAAYDDTEVRGMIGDNANAITALETKVGDSSVADQIDAVRATTIAGLTEEEKTAMLPTVALTEDMIQSSTNALGSDVIDNTKAIQDINNSAVMKSGITGDKVTAYDGYAEKITANETAAANAQAAAAQALTDAKTYAKDYADGLAKNYDATGSAAAAEAAAKAYADGLAGNYDAKGSATQALTDAKAYADGLADNYDAAGSATAAVATAKEYTDAEVKKVDDKLADYALKSTIGEVESGKTVVQMISDAKTAATYDDTGVKGLIAANTAAAEAAQNAADAAQADADAAQGAADAAQQTADNAIPKPSGDCANANYKCVLTFNNAQYAWEVIERNADGE